MYCQVTVIILSSGRMTKFKCKAFTRSGTAGLLSSTLDAIERVYGQDAQVVRSSVRPL